MSASSTDRATNAPEVLAALATIVRPQRILTLASASATIALTRAVELSAPMVSTRIRSVVTDPNDSSVEDFVRGNQPKFDFLEPISGSVFDLPARHLHDIGPFDLVWIGSDSLVRDARFLHCVWPHVAAGGVVAIDNAMRHADANPLWNAILRFAADDIETLTLPALGMGNATAIGLLRRRTESLRPVNFTDEMVAATGVPVRFESIGIHDDPSLLDHATGVLHVLADADLRAVLFAIGGGVSTLGALRSHTSLAERALNKAVARLIALSIVSRTDDGLVIDRSTFESFLQLPRRTPPPTEMSRYSRDRPAFLKAIADQMSETTWATEHHVNELCSLFDDDYATLRRELVDTGFLERNSTGSMYRSSGRAHSQP
ncbi:DUF2087 domain-containing protein [Rhodococcoides fascians A25f]|uniref:DUF2087 domain-containing protein n=1 Tax=Rhodococcoides fascians TaxID=1828 RepID=UPI000566E5CB|nr:DUF2087 domain-containing protein [Rhodococcus fascians]QII04709.1 DUF2087 domain-containing protein [Rhodococcus fascians A25f]